MLCLLIEHVVGHMAATLKGSTTLLFITELLRLLENGVKRNGLHSLDGGIGARPYTLLISGSFLQRHDSIILSRVRGSSHAVPLGDDPRPGSIAAMMQQHAAAAGPGPH